MTAQAVTAAVVAAINAELPSSAFSLDDVPNPRPRRYVEVSASRRYIDDEARTDGALSVASYRIYTTALAKVAGNADNLAEKVTAALDFATLTVAGIPTTVVFEAGDKAAPSDGWYVAVHTWTCTLPIESK